MVYNNDSCTQRQHFIGDMRVGRVNDTKNEHKMKYEHNIPKNKKNRNLVLVNNVLTSHIIPTGHSQGVSFG